MSYKIVDVPRGKGLVATKEFKIGDIVVSGDDKKYINDSMPAELHALLFELTSADDVVKWTIAYEKYSGNVKEEKTAFVAIAEIKVGDPIHYPYGDTYWLPHVAMCSTARPRTRLSCALVAKGFCMKNPLFPPILPTLSTSGKYSYLDPDMKSVQPDPDMMKRLQVFGFGELTEHEWLHECMICWLSVPDTFSGNMEQFKHKLKSCSHCGAPGTIIMPCGIKFCSEACKKKNEPRHILMAH